MAYKAINPYNGELIKEFPSATKQDVEHALATADQYYHAAKTQSYDERAHQLQKLATEFRQNIDQYAKPLTTNMGKLFSEAQGEVEKNAAFAEYYVKHGAEALQNISYNDVPDKTAYVEFNSIGAIMTVEPWNFPYTQVMRVFAPNFIIGNPVILKHASIVPECAMAFANAVEKAGIPAGAFTNLFVDHDQVEQIIADHRIQGVALTGSAGAGNQVAAQAGKYLKKSTMELGGTDVFIVLDDADLEAAIKGAVTARLKNAGQVCTAAKRFIVQSNHYADFIAGLSTAFAQQKLGDPLAAETTLAPLSSKKAQQKLQKQVQDAIAGGAKLLWGDPTPIEGPGAQFSPLIFAGIQPGNPLFDQEFFGPVAQVYQANDDAEVIKLANNSNFGLGGAIYSADLERAKRLASQIETGQIALNQPLNSYPDFPFGGVKQSGYGRELSDFGIREFVNAKLILY
ncbi:aldehyde dehydrogenase family protein [Loigolactobacillus backii]|uniref:Succinate-semialdehyde dehydrogenase n=1 Tax=Loigolactobacillus backii TaxID=375175 RepID=A0A192H4Y7_9LACO|nr:aldehyde dehydrogenase family protein [Loigolactobacillus backii]ANK60097.1 succinate-semialdehyde dehydrogenase [Loigolactobacillus backii]ANK63445.1 succinate-semialdehyde dehydrogenase [Loigolactobacillus backii]ANK64979.1 succinate-semialdehyde dehydrogenase [Loigolactobacillus backii]ANK66520.1 succinate-semialdehyde dehydrogenase [Loigolactobacillus backii]ANK69551.1 succinate-semialdehyde dehydrogenase [Loigolactobacillus backii]